MPEYNPPSMLQIFSAYCEMLLESMGYDVDQEAPEKVGFDLLAETKKDRCAVEIKWTHRPIVYRKQLYDWVPTMSVMPLIGTAERVLMASGTVNSEDIEWARKKYGIKVWDRTQLLDRANPILRQKLQRYFDVLACYPFKDRQTVEYREEVAEEVSERLINRSRGVKLIGQLKQTLPGRDHAKTYEAVCERIIDYLFGNVLIDPRSQSYSDDGLSILDIVYRLSPNGYNPVWEAIARDFRARAIVFECKNYSQPVTPFQLYTSERYLSAHALRTVCFLLTRKSPKRRTRLAAQAALRESGKLIVILRDEDLYEMLLQRDRQLSCEQGSQAWRGNDPSLYLDLKIHDLLATMPR